MLEMTDRPTTLTASTERILDFSDIGPLGMVQIETLMRIMERTREELLIKVTGLTADLYAEREAVHFPLWHLHLERLKSPLSVAHRLTSQGKAHLAAQFKSERVRQLVWVTAYQLSATAPAGEEIVVGRGTTINAMRVGRAPMLPNAMPQAFSESFKSARRLDPSELLIDAVPTPPPHANPSAGSQDRVHGVAVECDIDRYNHVNQMHYLRWIMQATGPLLQSCDGDPGAWWTASADIRYDHPIRMGDAYCVDKIHLAPAAHTSDAMHCWGLVSGADRTAATAKLLLYR